MSDINIFKKICEILDINITEFDYEVNKQNRIIKLTLNYENKKKLPAEITKLQNLQILDLNNNQLTEFPAEIIQLQNLRELILFDNQLTELPAEINQLQNLQILDLLNNQLTELSAEIAQLQSLQKLNLSYNKIIELPAEIGQLENLQVLDLQNNHLTHLPAEITLLQNLQELVLSSNPFIKFPVEITQLRNLQKLVLLNNNLTRLPEEIAQLQNLKVLTLGNNQLTRLPVEITQLRNLQILYLSANQLIELPEEITQLQNLQILYLSDNQFTELPVEVTQLPNLQILYLCDNQLTELPVEITQLPNLHDLYLKNNPLKKPPLIIANQGINEIKNYFKKNVIHNIYKIFDKTATDIKKITNYSCTKAAKEGDAQPRKDTYIDNFLLTMGQRIEQNNDDFKEKGIDAAIKFHTTKYTGKEEHGNGVDIGMRVKIHTDKSIYTQGILIQCIRMCGPRENPIFPELQESGEKQAKDMLRITSASYFMFFNFDNAPGKPDLETYSLHCLGDMGIAILPATYILSLFAASETNKISISVKDILPGSLSISSFIEYYVIPCYAGDPREDIIRIVTQPKVREKLYPVPGPGIGLSSHDYEGFVIRHYIDLTIIL